MARKRMPIAIDLFAGAGGLSLGLQEAGFEVRLAVEYDRVAAQTYRENLGAHVVEADLSEYSARELLQRSGLAVGECDLLAGGPPCQGFSVQRRGSDEDARNDLVGHYARFVAGIRPKLFLMENVSGLMSKRGRPFLDKLLTEVAKLGYSTHIAKLEAADFGVPQFRKRVILVGQRKDIKLSPFRFPQPTFGEGTYRTVREAIFDLPSPPTDGKPHPEVANHAREARLSARNIERLQHIPPGGGRLDLPEHLQLPCHVNNPSHRHVDVYGRLEWDKPSGTITARFDSFTRGRFAHPVEHRSLTLREGARLQTFPDAFIFHGNREEIARQIGNAVPPRMAYELGEAVLSSLYPMPPVAAVDAATVEQLTLAV
jgi:DNA (cytosine-5)-methyltransferase 1